MEIRRYHILLVEDNPADQRLAMEAFKECPVPCVVHLVDDGEEALSYLRRLGCYSKAPFPDLIVLDLNLPKKDGREVLAEIKLDPTLRKIPVIVMTSSEARSDIDKIYELQGNCYLTKPAELEATFALIKEVTEYWLRLVKLPSAPPRPYIASL